MTCLPLLQKSIIIGKIFFVGETHASWLVFMVYPILDLLLNFFVWDWRIFYVPKVFEEDAEGRRKIRDGLGRALRQ